MLINGYFASAAGGSASAVPLCWWQGWTGRWYVTSKMAIDRRACDAPGFFVLARGGREGCPIPLAVGVAADIEATLAGPAAGSLGGAVAAGADEIHVNLAGTSPLEHETAAFDIARAWNVPVLR